MDANGIGTFAKSYEAATDRTGAYQRTRTELLSRFETHGEQTG